MKTLLLLRHAKSSWKHPELDDHDRPLNKRGKRIAPIMGTLLQDEDLIPDLILCSSAVRDYTTALLVAKACTYKGETEQTLYGKKEDPASLLIPDNKREFTPWRSGYRTHGQAQNIGFISLYEIQDECYAVYFQIHE